MDQKVYDICEHFFSHCDKCPLFRTCDISVPKQTGKTLKEKTAWWEAEMNREAKNVIFRTDDMYGKYPTLDEIIRDYQELISIVGNVSTIAQAEQLNQKMAVRINSMYLEDFAREHTDADISYICYEEYGCLVSIYSYINHGAVDFIVFDVWSNERKEAFILGSSIENVQANYDNYLMWAMEIKPDEETKITVPKTQYQYDDLGREYYVGKDGIRHYTCDEG